MTPVRLSVLLLLGASAFGGVVPGRYIVELSTEPVVEHISKQSRRLSVRSEEASTHRDRLRAEQRGLRSRLRSDAVVLDTVDTVANAMFVRMTAEEAKQLAGDPAVRRIHPVRTLHLILDHAVQLMGVVDAWQHLPAGTAGSGVKIGIIDTGVDIGHPGLQDPSLTIPDGFPKVNSDADLAFTNSKVIVARSYVSLLEQRDRDRSAQDHVGHGTALAMIAAGVQNTGPLATITGVAPKAWIGSYKVFGSPGVNDSTTDDAVLKALDDAVADGMDVVNLSLGYDLAPRFQDDPDVEAIERATRAGVIIVVASGNNGPSAGTIGSPGSAPTAITVGASHNDRTFSASTEVEAVGTFIALNGSGTPASGSITGPAFDVSSLDPSGLACDSLPAGSATGRVVLILRGTCTFETKLINAQQAGATAAVVYAAESSPQPIRMGTGTATLPAQMISYNDGTAVKAALASGATPAVVLHFEQGPVAVNAQQMASFSSTGPNVDASIKPDLVAVGVDLYVATQSIDMAGDMYDATGYTLVDGTSFSSPMVAGAAALVKGARPGLTPEQYRSLLINTASDVGGTIQQHGAGRLNAAAAVRSTVTAFPTALRFGSGGSSPRIDQTLQITNTGKSTETYTVLVDATRGTAPVAGVTVIELDSGKSADIPLHLEAASLESGAHDGFVHITGTSSGSEIRVPWWYGVTSDKPAGITILSTADSGRRNAVSRNAILFRVTDAAGLPILSSDFRVVPVSEGGSVESLTSIDDEVPGLYSASVRLGPVRGENVFRIEAGDVTAEVSITGN